MKEDAKKGVVFEGRFYEFGSIEYKNLMLIEGQKKENENTLLGLIAKLEKEESKNNIVDEN